MTIPALRPLLTRLALLGVDTLVLSLLSLLLGRSASGGALDWPTLFFSGLLLLLWNDALKRRGQLSAATSGGLPLLLLLILLYRRPDAPPGFPATDVLLLMGGVIALLWYRSLNLTALKLGSLTMLHHLGRLLGAMVLLMAIMAFYDLIPSWRVGFQFGALALLALALARAEEVNLQGGTMRLPFSARWLSPLLASVGAVLLLALLLLPLVQRLWAGFVYLFQPLFGWLMVGLGYLLSILLLPLIQWVYTNTEVAAPAPPAPTPTPLPQGTELEFVTGPLAAPPPTLLPYVLLGFLLLVGFLIWRFWGGKGLGQQEQVGEISGAFGQADRAWSLGAWMRQQAEGLQARLRGRPRPTFGVDDVRALYRNLLYLGEQQGIARPPEATPYDYLEQLCHTFPQQRGDLAALTEAYVATHYGERVISASEIERLRSAWQRVAQAAQEEEGG